jgi:hypothetical protein
MDSRYLEELLDRPVISVKPWFSCKDIRGPDVEGIAAFHPRLVYQLCISSERVDIPSLCSYTTTSKSFARASDIALPSA